MKQLVALAIIVGLGCTARPSTPRPAAQTVPDPSPTPHDLQDHPVSLAAAELDRMTDAMAPFVARSRAELPAVRTRFMRGLADGETLFLTIRLPIPDRAWEQVFVRINEWDGGKIRGTLESDLGLLAEPKAGDVLTFDESMVLDWTIEGPNGREEGNRLGHWLEAQQPHEK